MAWFPSFNALKISKVFIATPLKRRYCHELHKQLKMPQETVHSVLQTMEHKQWLEREEEIVNESISTRPPRVFYRLTDHGFRAAAEALTALQTQVQVLFPVSS